MSQIDPNRPSFKELNEQLGRIEEHLRIEEESEKLKNIQIKSEQKPILYSETPVKNGNCHATFPLLCLKD